MISFDLHFKGSSKSLLPFFLLITVTTSLSFGLLTGCTPKNQKERTASLPDAPTQALMKRGKAIYQAQCTACHNSDPKKPGALGPDVYGSSKELLTARILHADYPPDYKAKRYTHQMQAMPHLKGEIDAIHAYLNEK